MYDSIMEMSVGEFELEDELADIAGALNVQHARLVDVAARAQRDGGWFGEGIHSIAHWLTIHVGLAPGRAKQIATIAGARASLSGRARLSQRSLERQ